jgi:hypothetical protein
MNGESKALSAGVVVFPMKPLESKVSEVKSIKITESEVSETRIVEKEGRFARLKKSLRRRSVSIL